MIEGYVTAKEIAEKWGIALRTVQTMCADGRVKGAAKFGGVWAIPKNTKKPTDNRIKTGAYRNWRKKSTSEDKTKK